MTIDGLQITSEKAADIILGVTGVFMGTLATVLQDLETYKDPQKGRV